LVSKDDNTALQYLTNVYKVILPKDIFGQKFINNIIQLYLNNFEDFENVQVIVVFNPTDSIIRFDLVKLKDVYQILFKKYIVTPTGVLFTKHDEDLSIQVRFIIDFMKLRKEVQKQSYIEFEKGNIDKAIDLENTQLAIKILLNSISYGISILPSYIYNDKNIANTITICGRFMIKFAQHAVDKLLPNFMKKYFN